MMRFDMEFWGGAMAGLAVGVVVCFLLWGAK